MVPWRWNVLNQNASSKTFYKDQDPLKVIPPLLFCFFVLFTYLLIYFFVLLLYRWKLTKKKFYTSLNCPPRPPQVQKEGKVEALRFFFIFISTV